MSAETGHSHKTFAEEQLRNTVTTDQLGISFEDITITSTPDAPEFQATNWINAGDLSLQIIDADEAKRIWQEHFRAEQIRTSSNCSAVVPDPAEVSRLAALMQQRLEPIEITGEGRVLQHCDKCGGYVLTRRLQYFQPSRDPADPLYRINDDVERYLCEQSHSISVDPEPARAPRQPAPGT